METLLVDLRGPFSLLSEEEAELLSSRPDAREPGLFIWAIEHNRAHRIHFVATATDSIAKKNLTLASQILLGERAIYNPIALEEGRLQLVTDGDSPTEQRCNAAGNAALQLQRMRVFFAPTLGTPEVDQLVCDGIIQKLLNFGELPTAWLEHSLRSATSTPDKQNLTVRFQRPAFIASLPDEMYL